MAVNYNPEYILDELYSLNDEDIVFYFGTLMSFPEIEAKYTISEIAEKLEKPFTLCANSSGADIYSNPNVQVLETFLRKTIGYTISEAENLILRDSEIKGEVVWYDKKKDYGLILVRRKGYIRKVFFYKPTWKLKKSIKAGDLVIFHLEIIDIPAGERKAVAVNLNVIGHVSVGRKDIVCSDKILPVRNTSVLRYGIANLFPKLAREKGITSTDVYNHGYSMGDFYYVYIRTHHAEYKVFRTGSPIKCDGYVKNLNDFLLLLDKVVLGINPFDLDGVKVKDPAVLDSAEQDSKNLIDRLCFTQQIKAELSLLGYTEVEQKKLFQKIGLDKKIKKNLKLENPVAPNLFIENIIGKNKPHDKNPKTKLWYKHLVMSELYRKGCTHKSIKSMLQSNDFYIKLNTGEIDTTVSPSDYANNLCSKVKSPIC